MTSTYIQNSISVFLEMSFIRVKSFLDSFCLFNKLLKRQSSRQSGKELGFMLVDLKLEKGRQQCNSLLASTLCSPGCFECPQNTYI